MFKYYKTVQKYINWKTKNADRLIVKGLTNRREMTKYGVCQHIYTQKGCN